MIGPNEPARGTIPSGSTTTDHDESPRTDLHWYAVYMLPRLESTAEVHLARQGFMTFVPRILTSRKHARRLESAKSLLFPRYGFISLDINRHRWRSVNGTTGVASLVMARDRPLPVPQGIVESLISAVTPQGVVDLDYGLRTGDTVRLVAGPFSGQFGTLKSLDEKGRVEMLVSLMNSTVRLRAPRSILQPAG